MLLFGDETFFVEQVKRHSEGAANSFVHVLLHSTSGDDDPNDQSSQCHDSFRVTDALWICRLPEQLRDIVYAACESPGVPHEKPFRQYGQLYTIALFAGPWLPGQLSSWDASGEITKFVTFSQLVHPTSIGFGNSARLTFGPHGKFVRADPGPCRGITEYAFTVPHHRNWLSRADCEQIRLLFENAKLEELSDRVARANWNLQHSAYQYFFEVRALLVVSGLEALLHTRSPKVRSGGRQAGTGKQFISRTKQLAEILKEPFNDADAQTVWEHRSDVAHGRDPWAARQNARGGLQSPPELSKSNEAIKSYLRADQLLRTTVLKCLLDDQFATIFTSDATVETRFPL
jgi:hypothetical protein